MTNLRQQLDEYIKRSSDNYELKLNEKLKRSGGDSALIEYAEEDFKAGANDIAKLLMIACEALEEYKKESHVLDQVCCDYGVQVGEQEWACCSQPITKAEKTLNKIQEMINGKK